MILEPTIPPLTAESMILLYQGRYICSVNLCIGAGHLEYVRGEISIPRILLSLKIGLKLLTGCNDNEKGQLDFLGVN